MLCSACHTALTTDVEGRMCWDDHRPQDFVHHPTSVGFYKAVESQCYICLTLLYQWEQKFRLRLPFPRHLDNGITHKSGEKIASRYFTRFYLGRGGRSMTPGPWITSTDESYYITIYLGEHFSNAVKPSDNLSLLLITFVVNPYNEVRHLLSNLSMSKNTADLASFSLVQSWLNDCLNKHSICNEHRATTEFQPTRILDLSGIKSRGQANLVDTTKTAINSTYATLSHCWGGTLHARLLKQNVTEFEQEIRISKLPTVYREAIDIALQLGVQYLWIDSLCIMQDDEADWLRESSRMFDIYRNAMFNIGATGATDGNGHCFVDRNINLLSPCLFNPESEPTATKPRLRDRLFKRKPKTEPSSTEESPPGDSTWHVVEEGFWTDRLHQQPLNQRAWVVQERLISRRMIHYARDQIYWECHELHACEAYPKGPQEMYELQALKSVHMDVIRKVFARQLEEAPERTRRLLPKVDGPSSELALMAWGNIVGEYSKRNLTVAKDKLVAFSGLAKLMQGFVQDQYVAGLWRSGMTMGLLWVVKHSSREGKPYPSRTFDSMAPSWSWASVKGQIHTVVLSDANLKEKMAYIHITIQDITLNPLGNDEMGALNSGVLKIKCSLWPAAFLNDDTREDYRDNHVAVPFFDLGIGSVDYDFTVKEFDCTLDNLIGPNDFGPAANLHVMPIMSIEQDEGGGPIITQGLILRQIKDPAGQVQYQRFGYFQHSAKGNIFSLAGKSMDFEHKVIELV